MTSQLPPRVLIARPVVISSLFADLMASIGAREMRSAYSPPPPNWAGVSFLITANPSIGRKRRARRARGRS